MRGSVRVSILAGFVATASGCAAAYVYGPTTPGDAPAKPSGCGFELLDTAPSRPFDELGVLAPKDIEYGDLSGGGIPFKESVGAQVCAAGGDAVVVERDLFSRYVRGTVIRYKP